MTVLYRVLSDLNQSGAGLYSAGRGFAPPGSTKPADAVFALRVTIPGAERVADITLDIARLTVLEPP